MTALSAAKHIVASARLNSLRQRAVAGSAGAPLYRKIAREGTLIHSPTPFIRPLHNYPSHQIHFTRGLSWASVARGLGTVTKLPAMAGTALVGGAAYVEYKSKQAWETATTTFNDVTGWLGDTYTSAREAMEGTLNSAKDRYDEFDEERKNAQQQQNGNQKDKDPNEEDKAAAAAAAAAVAAAVTPQTSEEDSDQIMMLTKKMIEIRSILQKVDQSDTLQLPSIVVIGSQSSGKSSVLEAIVGHEFLPKGSNMVTRRPIELTLVNTPESAAEYGEFPALGLDKMTDFSQIQRTLTDLNLSVSEKEAVSDDPIQLNIYSPHVPDLTMIDLPGYIQVVAADQPGSVKDKISKLCEKYIQPPNVILAISAADVDLANSSALKASRRVDPRGERTIGVVTKMDLVDPRRGADTLLNSNYPLQMGYVGVITRAPSAQTGLFRNRSANATITSLVAQNENNYFSQYDQYEDCTVGTLNLRDKLMKVLEKTMANSLQPTADSIHQELEEASYQFKVEYNDRTLTPQSYLAGSVDSFKLAFKELTNHLGRNEVKKILKSQFDQKVLDLLAQRYWNKQILDDYIPKRSEPALSDLPQASADDLYWHRKLDASTSALTKLGVGRLCTTLVINTLTSEMERLVDATNFRNHPFARDTIREAAESILNQRFYSTADQVENCVKPYKYEVEVEDREWAQSRDHAYNLLKEEHRQCEQSFQNLKRSIGSAKLNQVIKFIEKTREARVKGTTELTPPPADTEAFGFSQPLLQKGREAIFLRDRSEILNMRMSAVKSKKCKNKANKYYCPEVFLDVVSEKLTQTAVLFLNVELLSDFYYNFPRELDLKLTKGLSEQQIEVFAKEDVKIKNHIELQQRKELLELALDKIESVIELQKNNNHM